MRNMLGVTLIELMVVVVIIGILAGIAYPGYRSYTQKSRRSDAQILLLQAAARQEKFFSDCSKYAGSLAGTAMSCTAGGGQLGLVVTTPLTEHGYYQLAVPEAGNINGPNCQRGTAGADLACGFTLTANPVAGKSQDGNGALRIDAVGVRQWNKNNAGTWVLWSAN